MGRRFVWFVVVLGLGSMACRSDRSRSERSRSEPAGDEPASDERGVADPEPGEAQPAAPRVIALENGWGTSYALIDDGTVRAWGNGRWGAFGDGQAPNAVVPRRVKGVDDAVEIVADTEGFPGVCARQRAGGWTCWGDGRSLPAPATGPQRPTAIPALADATAISFGAWFGCAVNGDGRVLCWNHSPASPTYFREPRAPPTFVDGLTDIVDVRASSKRACALRRSGRVLCWGNDEHGQSSGTWAPGKTPRWAKTPTEVPGVDDAIELALGVSTTCARRRGGGLKCWGQTFAGGGVVALRAPATSRFLEPGGIEVCERTPAGATRCLNALPRTDCIALGMAKAGGCDVAAGECPEVLKLVEQCARGELGHAASAPPWRRLTAMPAIDVAITSESRCALSPAAEVWCWGDNDIGQLGDGTLLDRTEPRVVASVIDPVPPVVAPPLPAAGPKTPFDARPKPCGFDPRLTLVHPDLPTPGLDVVAAWAAAKDSYTEVAIYDYAPAGQRASLPKPRGQQRAVTFTVSIFGPGEFDIRAPTAGTYRRREQRRGRVARVLEGAVRSSAVYASFAAKDRPLTGTATITGNTPGWVCGTLNLRGAGVQIMGRYAAQIIAK